MRNKKEDDALPFECHVFEQIRVGPWFTTPCNEKVLIHQITSLGGAACNVIRQKKISVSDIDIIDNSLLGNCDFAVREFLRVCPF